LGWAWVIQLGLGQWAGVRAHWVQPLGWGPFQSPSVWLAGSGSIPSVNWLAVFTTGLSNWVSLARLHCPTGWSGPSVSHCPIGPITGLGSTLAGSTGSGLGQSGWSNWSTVNCPPPTNNNGPLLLGHWLNHWVWSFIGQWPSSLTIINNGSLSLLSLPLSIGSLGHWLNCLGSLGQLGWLNWVWAGLGQLLSVSWSLVHNWAGSSGLTGSGLTHNTGLLGSLGFVSFTNCPGCLSSAHRPSLGHPSIITIRQYWLSGWVRQSTGPGSAGSVRQSPSVNNWARLGQSGSTSGLGHHNVTGSLVTVRVSHWVNNVRLGQLANWSINNNNNCQ